MKKISKWFFTSLMLFFYSIYPILGTSDFNKQETDKSIEQTAISSDKVCAASRLSGTYVGSYTDYSRVHGLTLEISENNGKYKAMFSFYPISYSDSNASGRFSMNITKNQDGTYNFIQDQWISQPNGYEMVDIINCTLSNFSIKGDVCLNSNGRLIQIGNLFATEIDTADNTNNKLDIANSEIYQIENISKRQNKIQILIVILFFGVIFLGLCGFIISVYLLLKNIKK